MKIKKILALAVALTSVFAVAGCGSTGDSSSKVSTVKKVKVEDTQEIEAIPDDAQKTIRWMGTYDLNPDEKKGEDKSVEMTLFNNKGGKVEYTRVTDSEKFDQLASAIMAQQNVPDIFKYEWMAFPAQVLKDMYQPVDDIVNFDDPYELYQNNEWNWDKWYDMMSEFVSNAPADVERFGINGWFQTQVIQQTGKTMVNYDGEKFTNNINDPDIERAEDLLYQVGKNNLVNGNWLGNAKQALKDGNLLFYCMGTWAMTGNNGPSDADTWRVVPVPSDPNTDEKYMTSDMTAYMWVRGSTAKEAVKCWYECCRMANTDETYKENGKEKFLNANPNWTEDMYQVIVDCSSSEYNQVFDYGYGISSTMSDDNANEDGNCVTRKLYEYTNKADDNGKQFSWTELRESYSATVDAELKTINDAVVAFNKKNS